MSNGMRAGKYFQYLQSYAWHPRNLSMEQCWQCSWKKPLRGQNYHRTYWSPLDIQQPREQRNNSPSAIGPPLTWSLPAAWECDEKLFFDVADGHCWSQVVKWPVPIAELLQGCSVTGESSSPPPNSSWGTGYKSDWYKKKLNKNGQNANSHVGIHIHLPLFWGVVCIYHNRNYNSNNSSSKNSNR